MASNTLRDVAVVMVPLPAQGHLNQLLHLSRRLVSSSAKLPVFYLGTSTHLRQAKLRLDGSDVIPNLTFLDFPTPPFQNPLPDPHALRKFPSHLFPSISSSTSNLRDPVFSFVNELSTEYRKVVVIYDTLMAYAVQDIHTLPYVTSYRFWSVSAITMCFFRWNAAGRPEEDLEASILKEIPDMDEHFPPEFRTMSRASEKDVSGTIYNSSRVIEGVYLDMLANGDHRKQQHWAIGPFNPVEKRDRDSRRHKCMDWLDKQDRDSVMLVSFGTTSAVSDEQIKELAFGLEKSEHKFVWVLRDADKGDIFSGEVRKLGLPEGFEERVRERGMVVRDWAPQLEVLGHVSTGGFMSHCGWNSCMESISMGVPIAAWPMHSDQPVNAVLVTKVLRIGVEVKSSGWGDEVVLSSVVESVVRKLMGSEEGDEMRKRAKELGVCVKSSVMEGGSSSKEMDSFVAHITAVKSKL